MHGLKVTQSRLKGSAHSAKAAELQTRLISYRGPESRLRIFWTAAGLLRPTLPS